MLNVSSVMVGGTPTTSSVKLSELEVPSISVAVAERLNVPSSVAIPLNAPVELLKLIPAGKVPVRAYERMGSPSVRVT